MSDPDIEYWTYECMECGDVTTLEGQPIEDCCPMCEEVDNIAP